MAATAEARMPGARRPACAAAARGAGPRCAVPLAGGWRFHFGDAGEAPAQPGFDDSAWAQVRVPHSWNRVGNYGAERAADADRRQGPGWYRLHLRAPLTAAGVHEYLDFAAVSNVADVWVNGVHLGQHRGAFSRFRFDATAAWHPGGDNLVAVRADNSRPAPGSPTADVLPLAADFFTYGGIYRPVALVFAGEAGIDLLDDGGPGVYAHATRLSPARAEVAVLTRLRDVGGGAHRLRLTLTARDAQGAVVAVRSRALELRPGTAQSSDQLVIARPHLWDGTRDPYLYALTAELSENDRIVDRVTQPLGLRSLRFDPAAGFFLNGRHLALHGVARHQDRAGEGWALAPGDAAEDMATLREMGANAVRLAHYQHADDWVGAADRAGVVAWAEVPFTETPSLTGGQGTPALWANAEQQLRELIRQDYNHPAIVMWSVGNEVDAAKGFGVAGTPPQPLPLLRQLNAEAHALDPSRPTTFADCCEDVGLFKTGGEVLAGTADLVAYNRYFGWYMPQPLDAGAELGAALDHLHAKHRALPMGLSEYGAGGALSQHSDNVADGFLNFTGRPQPEEFESFVHEANWPAIAARRWLYASFAWNLFDFASDLREEGDSFDLNTKGLVAFDHRRRKDAFYYYKAQWNPVPMIWLTGKRYAARAYAAMTVKAYTNAARASLSLDGHALGEVPCPGGICQWPGVALHPGANRAVVTAMVGGRLVRDDAAWQGPDLATNGIRILAGSLGGATIGGHVYGSDDFVTGGTPMVLNMGGFGGRRLMAVRSVSAPEPRLYDFWREGEAFRYAIPVPDGPWTVTIHTMAPRADAATLMSVSANGALALAPVNVLGAAGGPLTGIARSFPVTVKGGVLTLDFAGQNGRAVLAAIEITRR
ncbi:MAG: beta-galactosidase [Sphingomonadales bacterium]|nr:beta-galactosidase [Sphingomonadales bacterium]